MPTDSEKFQLLLDEILQEFPKFKLVRKADSRFMWLLSKILLVLTFGSQKSFMSDYTTVIRYTVYTPEAWDLWPVYSKESLLRHERIHMRQSDKYTFPLYMVLYLLVPFPLGLAYYRAKFEKEAYTETMRLAYVRHGQSILYSETYRQHFLKQFTTGRYGWMWPFLKPMDDWYWKAVDDIVRRPRQSMNAVWSEEPPTLPEGKTLPPKDPS